MASCAQPIRPEVRRAEFWAAAEGPATHNPSPVPLNILPRERSFFVLFDKMAAYIVDAATQLDAAIREGGVTTEVQKSLRAIEHDADGVMHELIQTLNRTFVTPFDREDIYQLASGLDDVIDYLEEISDTAVLYGITKPPEASVTMAKLLAAAANELQAAVGELDSRKDIQRHGIEIHRIENEGDACSRAAIGALFTGRLDPLDVIRFKDLYTLFENALDRCEDVANVIESMTIKNA